MCSPICAGAVGGPCNGSGHAAAAAGGAGGRPQPALCLPLRAEPAPLPSDAHLAAAHDRVQKQGQCMPHPDG